MHPMDEKITLDDRLDKACEPGVDYGEWARARGCLGERHCVAMAVCVTGCECPWLHMAIRQAVVVADVCVGVNVL